MPTPRAYDPDLQMFVVAPTDPDPRRLAFQQYLATTGRYHDDVGPTQRCDACNGTHTFRLICALALEAAAGSPS